MDVQAATSHGFDTVPATAAVAVHTLGRFSIFRRGDSAADAMRLPGKPVELLQALIALGGRDVNVHTLCRTVWPDEASADPRNLLDNTLHRLRALLGSRGSVALRDGRLSLDPLHCWVDVWAFERLAARALEGAGSADAAAALRLYQGHFLEREAPRPWHVVPRTRLRMRLTRLLLHEGARREAINSAGSAADWYARGLEIDPTCDELSQRLAACRSPSAAALRGMGLSAPLDSGILDSRR